MAKTGTDTSRRSGGPGGTRRREVGRLIGLVVAAFVLVEALLLGVGLLVTRVLDETGLHTEEEDAERAILGLRTPTWNDVTTYGTLAGATLTVIVLTAVGCLVLFWLGRGPRLAVFLAVAVAGQTSLFLLAALFIDRERPDIRHLDVAPPTSSFPSGHTAATIALSVGLMLALYSLRRRPRLLALGWVVVVVYVGFVMASRLYRGMHWPTDVAASVLYALIWLFLLRAILLRDRPDRSSGRSLGAGSRSEPPPVRR
jgi:membrane-associated phospholipid phosphatase